MQRKGNDTQSHLHNIYLFLFPQKPTAHAVVFFFFSFFRYYYYYSKETPFDKKKKKTNSWCWCWFLKHFQYFYSLSSLYFDTMLHIYCAYTQFKDMLTTLNSYLKKRKKKTSQINITSLGAFVYYFFPFYFGLPTTFCYFHQFKLQL